jgi:hypothetical protein
MKKYILRYLTENYFLDKSQLGNAGIYNIGDNRDDNPPVNAKVLIEEIVTVFGYSFTRTKWIINDWAKSQRPDLCLRFYWSSHEFNGLIIPAIRRAMSRTIGHELISVKPMSKPTGLLTYGELDHPTPQYIVSSDPATPDAEPTVFKVEGVEAMRLQRERVIEKWKLSGLLDNFDPRKKNIADFYDGKSRQLLE